MKNMGAFLKGQAIFLIAVAALLVLPGCLKKKKEPSRGVAHKVVKGKSKGGAKVSAMASAKRPDLPAVKYFDEDVEGFVLAEDQNAFDPDVVVEVPVEGATKVAEASPVDADGMWSEELEDSRYNFKTVFFDFDKHDIKPDQKVVVAYDSEVAKRVTDDGKDVVCEGHACHAAGSRPYNLAKSEKRGWTMKNKLADSGVDPERIKVVGRGVDMPLIEGGDKNEQAPNRRCELVIA